MFSSLVSPCSDELFSTWLADMLSMNGVTEERDRADFLRIMTGKSFFSADKLEKRRYVPDAEDLCRAESGSGIFPRLIEILHHHTDIYALLPFMAKEEQAVRTEYCLRGHESGPNLRLRHISDNDLMICPECAKEDQKSTGRQVVHVPHQLYVKRCWKHGCLLRPFSGNEPVPSGNERQETETAVFMHELFMRPLCVDCETMQTCIDMELKGRALTRQEALKLAYTDGYVSREVPDTWFLKDAHAQISDGFYEFYAGFLTWLFGTAENFVRKAGIMPLEYTRPDFEILDDSDGILFRFKCKNCSRAFYMHPYAAECGTPCPDCIKNMSDTEVYKRYADFLDDGVYDVTKENGKICIVHAECGTDRSRKFMSKVWKRAVCPVCKQKHERMNHVGESNAGMTIIGFNRADDVTVLTGDGEIVPHRNYFYFKRGIETGTRERMGKRISENQTRTDRVGEKNVNYQGVGMTVVRYGTRRDIDVQFDTGDFVPHRKYEDFLDGRIRCPSFIASQRIGETRTANNGKKMTIIRYGSTKDMDVRFETGEIAEHVCYNHFKNGTIGIPRHKKHSDK